MPVFTEIKECVDGIADGLDVGCLWSGHIGVRSARTRIAATVRW
jgi:hypothetical protein